MNINQINWVLVLVIGTLIVYGIRGKREGLVRTVFGMLSFVIALGVASILSPTVSEAIKSNDRVIPYVTQKVETKNLTLPEILKESLTNHNTVKNLKDLAIGKSEDYVRVQLANWIVNAISFVLILLIAFVILWYICHILDIISKLPILNGLNKTAGMLVGVLRGFITIWMWCIVLMIFSTSHIGQIVFGYINESEFLSIIYNNNLLFQFGKIIL
ncbi:MAG: CvpA family protein [Velocimicrobium sp.]